MIANSILKVKLVHKLIRVKNQLFLNILRLPIIKLKFYENKNYIGFVEADTDAVDNEHPGSNWHKTLAELFFNRYKKI